MQLGHGENEGQRESKGPNEGTGHLVKLAWFGPTHGCWDWLLQHFEHVTLLSETDVRDWLKQQSDISKTVPIKAGTLKTGASKNSGAKSAKNTDAKNKATSNISDAVLLAAFEHRSDPRLNVWHSALAEFPTTSSRFATVLGSDWQGHRRTFPLTDATESFYWFQFFDRIVPWVLRNDLGEQHSQIEPPAASVRKSTLTGGSGGTNPRVSRLLELNAWYPNALGVLADQNHLAWIVSDHREHRLAWQETLLSYGVRTVASLPGEAQFWATPDLIVIDCSTRDDHPSESISQAMRDILIPTRDMYPDAYLVFSDPFPTWGRWESLLELGVDALVPRPADFVGTLVSWQLWSRRIAGVANNAILP